MTLLAAYQPNEDQDEVFNLCKIVSFDERVKEIYTSRAYCSKGFFAVLTNTKFSVYQAFVEIEDVKKPDDDDEHEKEDEINISMPTTVHINCSKLWDVPVRISIP